MANYQNLPAEFRAAFEAFMVAYQAKINKHFTDTLPNLRPPIVTFDLGRKYIRVIKDEGHTRSTAGFIEISSGNLLKSDGWSGPAKGVRGNLFQPDYMERVGVYGGIG